VKCFHHETEVYNSRRYNGRVWRRRRCRDCTERFTTYEVTSEEFKKLMEQEKLENELDEPIWAVVSFDHVKGMNLTHAEAVDIVNRLDAVDDNSLTIVTAAAAARFKPNGRKVD
jgi:transcriptional regulator NrdR family protein